jgi:phosphoribosylanthranilate isomerase
MVDKYNSIVGKFIRGPLSNNQILEFTKYGVNAVRIYLYIRMQEGKLVSSGDLKPKEHTWIALDNKNTEAMVGLHKSHKWDKLRTLEQKGLIELKTEKGKAPRAKIIVPSLH